LYAYVLNFLWIHLKIKHLGIIITHLYIRKIIYDYIKLNKVYLQILIKHTHTHTTVRMIIIIIIIVYIEYYTLCSKSRCCIHFTTPGSPRPPKTISSTTATTTTTTFVGHGLVAAPSPYERACLRDDCVQSVRACAGRPSWPRARFGPGPITTARRELQPTRCTSILRVKYVS